MYELKSGDYYTAIILGICNCIVGSCTYPALALIQKNINENLVQFMTSFGIVCGTLIAEVFFAKLSKNHAIPVIMLMFLISVFLIFFLSSYQSNLAKAFALLSFSWNFSVQMLLFIVELGYLSKYIKSNPNTFSLTVLLSLNQLGFIFGPLFLNIKLWQYAILYIIVIWISIIVTWRFEVEPRFFANISELKKNTTLPFSVFSISFYSFGAVLASYDIIAENNSDKFTSQFIMFSMTLGYVIGSSIITILINKSQFSLAFIILGLSTIGYIFIIPFGFENYLYCATGVIGCSLGMIENINIRIIIVNSLRPEFFIGLFYFQTYVLHGAFVIFYK
ncbi:hypothetical protein SteCoe_10815 [Stentor coeruleus]|uniref:Uncharacterized protein n=1 Tax=Stentor coeruleus TaxID=5963 RepID=A0A1R2CEP5_9CILI|nr:hypothetical protein SteCoe_10815 [Stentor coeruleus]